MAYNPKQISIGSKNELKTPHCAGRPLFNQWINPGPRTDTQCEIGLA